MSAADNLRAARALIEDPKHWTKGVFARSASGTSVPVADPAAVCFCSVGALEKLGVAWALADSKEFKCLSQAMSWSSVGNFNDTSTHAEVLAAFDKAIELAEAQ